MKYLRGHLKLHYCDIRKSFAIFWLVVLAVFTLNLATMAVFGKDGNIGLTFTTTIGDQVYDYSTFLGAVLFSVLIYLLIGCFGTLSESYGFAIGLGSARRDYYGGLVLSYLIVAAAISVILIFIYLVEGAAYNHLDREQLNMLRMIFQGSDGMFHHLAFYFTLFTVAIAMFSLLAVLFYRIGRVFWLFLLVVFFALVLIAPLREWAWEFVRFFSAERSFALFNLKLLGLAAVLFICGWPVIRKAEVKAPAGA